MSPDRPHSGLSELERELALLLRRIESEPVTGEVRELTRQLQDALDERRANVNRDPDE